MRIRDIFRAVKGVPGADLTYIVAHALRLRKEEVLANPDRLLNEAETGLIDCLAKERREGKPLAYITGRQEFYSETFFVDPRVLIPRPETELLVDEAMKILRSLSGMPSIVDVGTGSGAIGLVVAKRASVKVLCIDISLDALMVAKKNSMTLNVAGMANFLCCDIFGAISRGNAFDVVLANLPYVANSDWQGLMKDVGCFEPRTALLGGADGLDIYRRLASGITYYLKSGGYVLCEIDGPVQAEAMRGILVDRGLDVRIIKDYSDRERVLIGHG